MTFFLGLEVKPHFKAGLLIKYFQSRGIWCRCTPRCLCGTPRVRCQTPWSHQMQPREWIWCLRWCQPCRFPTAWPPATLGTGCCCRSSQPDRNECCWQWPKPPLPFWSWNKRFNIIFRKSQLHRLTRTNFKYLLNFGSDYGLRNANSNRSKDLLMVQLHRVVNSSQKGGFVEPLAIFLGRFASKMHFGAFGDCILHQLTNLFQFTRVSIGNSANLKCACLFGLSIVDERSCVDASLCSIP